MMAIGHTVMNILLLQQLSKNLTISDQQANFRGGNIRLEEMDEEGRRVVQRSCPESLLSGWPFDPTPLNKLNQSLSYRTFENTDIIK